MLPIHNSCFVAIVAQVLVIFMASNYVFVIEAQQQQGLRSSIQVDDAAPLETYENEHTPSNNELRILQQEDEMCTYDLEDYDPFEGTDFAMNLEVAMWLKDGSTTTQNKALKQTKKALPKAMALFMAENAGFRASLAKRNFFLYVANANDIYVREGASKSMSNTSSILKMDFQFPSLWGEITYKCKKGSLQKNDDLRSLFALRLSKAFADNWSLFLEDFEQLLKRTENYDFVNILPEVLEYY